MLRGPLNMFLILRIHLSSHCSQAVSGIESLLITIEAMAARPKPDGKLSEFLAAMKKQRQQEGGEPGRFMYQVYHIIYCSLYIKSNVYFMLRYT